MDLKKCEEDIRRTIKGQYKDIWEEVKGSDEFLMFNLIRSKEVEKINSVFFDESILFMDSIETELKNQNLDQSEIDKKMMEIKANVLSPVAVLLDEDVDLKEIKSEGNSEYQADEDLKDKINAGDIYDDSGKINTDNVANGLLKGGFGAAGLGAGIDMLSMIFPQLRALKILKVVKYVRNGAFAFGFLTKILNTYGALPNELPEGVGNVIDKVKETLIKATPSQIKPYIDNTSGISGTDEYKEAIQEAYKTLIDKQCEINAKVFINWMNEVYEIVNQ